MCEGKKDLNLAGIFRKGMGVKQLMGKEQKDRKRKERKRPKGKEMIVSEQKEEEKKGDVIRGGKKTPRIYAKEKAQRKK